MEKFVIFNKQNLTFLGHIKGKTLLPFPQQGAARIEAEEARVRASSGDDCDMTLKNNIEGRNKFNRLLTKGIFLREVSYEMPIKLIL